MSLPSRRLPACTRSTTLSASTDGVLCDPLDDARTAGGALGVAIPEFAAVCLRPLPCASCCSKKPLNGSGRPTGLTYEVQGIGPASAWAVCGLAASTALENLPVGLCGLASGVLQQGYAVGYLIAAVISLELVPTVNVGWRALSWTASGISIFGAALCALLPKSSMFMKFCTFFSCKLTFPRNSHSTRCCKCAGGMHERNQGT
ncbi:hypothetical protein B0H14DRAFT_3864804 [Mycena olivaceomarginata]|nr:hypothetical protein B0H14DRAFT_3864804 [Mycena olivaceomarginata]